MTRTAKIVLACIAVAAIIAAMCWLPVGAWARAAIEQTRELGVLGVAAFAAVFVIVGLLMLPMVELYIAAGVLYGIWWGALLTTALGVLVELCTLWLVHTRLRGPIDRRIRAHPTLAALDRGVSEHPFWILLLLRLSPVMPFAPLNYTLAMANVPLWQRVITNAVGMLPMSLAQAYLGSLLSGLDHVDDAHAPTVWAHIALWGGLAAVVGAGLLTAWATKRALRRQHRA